MAFSPPIDNPAGLTVIVPAMFILAIPYALLNSFVFFPPLVIASKFDLRTFQRYNYVAIAILLIFEIAWFYLLKDDKYWSEQLFLFFLLLSIFAPVTLFSFLRSATTVEWQKQTPH